MIKVQNHSTPEWYKDIEVVTWSLCFLLLAIVVWLSHVCWLLFLVHQPLKFV